jgi:methyl-accepting chemotaxis protein
MIRPQRRDPRIVFGQGDLMLGWFQQGKSRRLLALDALRVKVMISDANLNVVYLNPALREFLEGVEDDLKKELPNFSMAKMVGSNIDIFHKRPDHQRTMLAQLKQRHLVTITVSKHVFDLLVIPLMAGNKRTGFALEWADASERLANLDYAGKWAAIGRGQALIEFTSDGTVLTANENFLRLMGYTLGEIVGKHHSLCVDPAERKTPEYAHFWSELRAGKFQAAEFRRLTKLGTYVTIQGSYNPILDEKGNVIKIVKICMDVTNRDRSITEIAAGLSALADGDLERRITEPLTIELDPLRVDLNRAADKLQETMTSIAANADAVREGAGEITRASDDLARRTEQQAASIEETAAALDQITATVRKSAEGAQEARGVVGTAKDDAQRSGTVVHEAVTAMHAIESSAKKIENIIGVIDEIAFQTNLLALNAGVEAARAGDAGRGFAVVATEVRALAQRSADAAKEIKALISESGRQVEAGVRLVGLTGDALTRIVGHVDQISVLTVEIASAAQEQSTALGEVNAAVNQMDKSTQQNAAMVEQSTAASHSLTNEAGELSRLVGQFKTGAGQTSRPSRGAPPKPQFAQRPPAARPAAPRETVPLKRPASAESQEDSWSEF